MTLYKWSQIAANNATADGLINWQEGQAPSSVNDSARQMMAAVAKYRDDVSGAIVTSGTSTAYTVSSFETFDTLAHLGGQTIAFTPHATNGATVTLNVDSLGAKPVRASVGVDLMTGVLIQGTPYVALYNNSDGVFYLQGFYGNPYNVPLAAGMDYWGPTTPNSAFAFPAGQAISRTTYAALFALIGTTYGVGDGSTTFSLPDKTGRVSAMKEAVATRLTAAGAGVDGATLGSAAGGQTQTLIATQIPAISSAGNNTITVRSNRSDVNVAGDTDNFQTIAGSDGLLHVQKTQLVSSDINTITVASTNTGGSAPTHPNVQPTIVCNYIIRIV